VKDAGGLYGIIHILHFRLINLLGKSGMTGSNKKYDQQ
jgi:hypothetical protein